MTSSSARSSFPTSLLSTLQTLQTPRILLLHGSHQTASILQDRLQRLTTALQTLHPTPTLIYLNAPHTLPLIPGDALPLRTWSTNTCICVSLATIDEAWKRGGGFDGVIGFSEGAAVGVVVASLRERFKGLGWGVFVGVPKVIPCHYNVGEVGIPALVVTGQGDTLVPSD
ncbi:serine hydrolase FSH, partial [Chytridium lagenaria]